VKLLLVHGLSLLSDLLGSPPAEHSPDEAQRAGESAAGRLPGALAALSQGMDRVVVVGDGASFRKRIDPQHTERPSRARAWRAEAWTVARRCMEELVACSPALDALGPPRWPNPASFLDLGGGDALSLGGELAAARDVIATVAVWWWRKRLLGDVLRIVSGRSTLAALHDPAAGIEVVYDVRDEQGWTWRTREPSPLAVEVRVLIALGDAHKAANGSRKSVLGEETARGLAETYRTAEAAVRMAGDSEKPRNVRGPVLAALKWAAEGERWRRVDALVRPRVDAAVDVAALFRAAEVEQHGGGEDEDAARAVPAQGGRPGGEDSVVRAPGRSAEVRVGGGGAGPDRSDAPRVDGEHGAHGAPADVRGGPHGVSAPEARKETRAMDPRENEQPYDDRPADPGNAMALRPEAPLARQPPPPAPAMVPAPPPVAPMGPRTTDATGELYMALARAQLKFGKVEKSRNNDHFKSKYANLADIMEAILPALKEEQLVPMQIPAGNRLFVRIVHGPSGQWIEGSLQIVAPDQRGGIQALGSALTYTRRYLLTMMLGIVAFDEEDDDGNAAQGRQAQQRRAG